MSKVYVICERCEDIIFEQEDENITSDLEFRGSYCLYCYDLCGEDEYNRGEEEGRDAGYESGYDRGFEEGKREGYNEGHDDGYADGYEEGATEEILKIQEFYFHDKGTYRKLVRPDKGEGV